MHLYHSMSSNFPTLFSYTPSWLVILLAASLILDSSIASAHRQRLLHRIAYGSCNTQKHGDIWGSIAQSEPDMLLLLGDTIYADRMIDQNTFEFTSIEKLTELYADLNARPGFQKLLSTVGGWQNVMATYDDHDFGINNADKNFPFRNESMQAFWDFAHVQPYLRRPTGVYSSKKITLRQNLILKVILLDIRSNKDPKGTINGDFLGHEQWQWLENELLHDREGAHLTIIGSPIQILPDGKIFEESWHEFPLARERLLQLISVASVRTNIFLLSGDIHSAEVLQATCALPAHAARDVAKEGSGRMKLWEFTSSGFSHTFTTYAIKVEDEYEGYVMPIQLGSRGYFKSVLYDYYQAMSAFHYRESKYADHFNGLNYGLIDVIEGGRGSGDEEFTLSFKILNHVNTVAIEKKIPLSTKQIRNHTLHTEIDEEIIRGYYNRVDELAATGQQVTLAGPRSGRSICTAIHGDLSIWREYVFRGAMVFIPFILFVLPCLVVLWFLFAAIMYLIYGTELLRRDSLMQRYIEKSKAQ